MKAIRLAVVAGSRDLRAIIGEANFGYTTYFSSALPDRLWVGENPAQLPDSLRMGDPQSRLLPVATPAVNLDAARERRAWTEPTQATIHRLQSLWLLCEDPFRLLDSRAIEPLAHQASLVDQVLADPNLKRVLIADEVGLGKTIEAALIIQRLLQREPTLRILYLTESRLVRNVVEEFRRLDLNPRCWSRQQMEARLGADVSDSFVVGSMHLAVGSKNRFATVKASGPWDLLIVDEAHHLSDYSLDGGDPRRRMQLVRELISHRLRPEGRLILLTATPHQGHLSRYKNLLRLLSKSGKDESEARGRVIYRIKEDITDWDHQALFPVRRIHEPTEVEVHADYFDWLETIRRVFTNQSMSRAAGWRRAQALQWAASSPVAGVAYLARFAVRSGLDPESVPELKDAILALRPFRGGPVDENWQSLYSRFLQTGRINLEEDLDLDEDGNPVDDDLALSDLLLESITEGVELVRSDAFDRKLSLVLRQLDSVHPSKLVVFAQPVETVWAIKHRLEALRGNGTVSIIVGGQDDEARRREIECFWDLNGGSEVLVSSRSGGEGINLQVSNQLVHFDVPWNPMELEQRVGRVHRYGSVSEIHVNTLVVAGSRELRVLQRARAKLASIARAVGWDEERRDQLFGRTMSQIPWEELSSLMVGENLGPLTDTEERHLQELVQEGYDSWHAYDQEAREASIRLQQVDRGPLRDTDLEYFLIRVLGAQVLPGWKVSRPGETTELQADATTVLELPSGQIGHVGPRQGVSWVPPVGEARRPLRIGLNHPWVAQKVRDLSAGLSDGNSKLDQMPEGTGVLQLPADPWESVARLAGLGKTPESILAQFTLTRRISISSQEELSTAIGCRLSSEDPAAYLDLDAVETAALIRELREARPAQRRLGDRFSSVIKSESDLLDSIKASSLSAEEGIQAAVFPIATILLFEENLGT